MGLVLRDQDNVALGKGEELFSNKKNAVATMAQPQFQTFMHVQGIDLPVIMSGLDQPE